MRITNYLNTNPADVASKKFNVFIGVSLGNKYFTKEHLKSYMAWAAENTKDRFAVLIPDKIHAINYEVKNGYSPKRALTVARRKGDEVENMALEISGELKIPNQKMRILRWEEIEDEIHKQMLAIFRKAFHENQEFRAAIIAITKETPHLKDLDLNDTQHEKLSKYVIDELPLLISGMKRAKSAMNYSPTPASQILII